MELRHLKYFIAVAEELHFSRAAKRLNMAQPPLSQQIQQLENELGVQLFFRTNRQVKLTDAGKIFLKNAYSIFKDIEKTCIVTRQTAKGKMGAIIVGFTGTATFDILPKLIQSYRTKYPAVMISVQQLNSAVQLELLLKNEINIGIICTNIRNPNLAFNIIRREPFVVALPQKHYLSIKDEPIEVQELSSELFIMTVRSDGETYYDLIIRICQNAGFSPNIIQEVHELHTALALVSAGIGIVLVPQSLQKIHIDGVIYRPLKNSLFLETALAWRKDEHSLLVDNFLEMAKTEPNWAMRTD